MDIIRQISEALEQGDEEKVNELTQRAIEKKVPVASILNDGLISGMAGVGQKFKAHDIFLPDVLLAARAMSIGMDLLKPLLLAKNIPSIGKIVIGTVQGDLHDIGKNLVAIMLKGAGFEIIDLGNDVPAERFVSVALDEKASLIGMSALLTTTMSKMKAVTDLLKERGLSDKIKVFVGGAPLSEDYASQIGADGFAYDAISAVEKAKFLLGIN